MTTEQIEEIRARQRDPLDAFENPKQAHRDIAALLAHIDRYAALTPEVIETLLAGMSLALSLTDKYGRREQRFQRFAAARAVLESLKETTDDH